MPSIFSRYAPFVQDFIYRNGWERLRGIQVAAGDAVFNTDAHVLLTASTASGKTEAAFFPILTLLSENPSASVGALYIAPLKALINDQFERLTDLCAEGGIPVWSWHGDVAQSRKKKLLEHPSGVLQITPESLEAMLLRKHAMIPTLFGDLRFIVIDEIHSLMRSDRGLQTMCLIERLSRLAGTEPRRIGLSATIGNTTLSGAAQSAPPLCRRWIRLRCAGGSLWSISGLGAKKSARPTHRSRRCPPTPAPWRIPARRKRKSSRAHQTSRPAARTPASATSSSIRAGESASSSRIPGKSASS